MDNINAQYGTLHYDAIWYSVVQEVVPTKNNPPKKLIVRELVPGTLGMLDNLPGTRTDHYDAMGTNHVVHVSIIWVMLSYSIHVRRSVQSVGILLTR